MKARESPALHGTSQTELGRAVVLEDPAIPRCLHGLPNRDGHVVSGEEDALEPSARDTSPGVRPSQPEDLAWDAYQAVGPVLEDPIGHALTIVDKPVRFGLYAVPSQPFFEQGADAPRGLPGHQHQDTIAGLDKRPHAMTKMVDGQLEVFFGEPHPF